MEHTLDAPAPGLKVAQPRRGFRYGAESFWLAGFALEGGPADSVLDLGTGSGIVALLLAGRGLRAVGVDVQSRWEPLWEHTLAASEVPGTIELRIADVAGDLPAGFDLVVSNPPFFAAGSGPHSADPFKRTARTETTATLDRFVQVALESGERACFVVPIEREARVVASGRARGAGARRRVRVGRRRVLIELVAGAADGPVDAVAETDPRVRRWYAAVSQAPWRS